MTLNVKPETLNYRVAFLGVGHWHTARYLGSLAKVGARVVSVWDSDRSAAERVAAQLDLSPAATPLQALERGNPEFVYITPRPDEAPAVVETVLRFGLPAAAEKPMGLNAGQVQPLADLADQLERFVAVAFVGRYDPIWRRVQELRAQERLGPVAHFHQRVVNGSPARYERDGVAWNLRPETAGGGSLRNLGIHCVDAFLRLTGSETAEVAGGSLSRRLHRRAVEEFAAAVLVSPDGATGTLEAAYTYPSMFEGGDPEVRVAAANAYLIQRAGELLCYTGDDDATETTVIRGPGNYERFVADTFSRWRQGLPPIATVRDCLRANRVVDAIYMRGQAAS